MYRGGDFGNAGTGRDQRMNLIGRLKGVKIRDFFLSERKIKGEGGQEHMETQRGEAWIIQINSIQLH